MESYVVEVTTPETGRRFLSQLPDVWRPEPERAHLFNDAREACRHAQALASRDFQPMVVAASIHPLFQHQAWPRSNLT